MLWLESRLRRMAERQDAYVAKSRRRDKRALDYRLYRLHRQERDEDDHLNMPYTPRATRSKRC